MGPYFFISLPGLSLQVEKQEGSGYNEGKLDSASDNEILGHRYEP